jgi:hypothetical protein
VSAEGALEAAIMAALDGSPAVTGLLGSPVRLLGAEYRPPFPYLEVARHQSVDLGAAGVVSSEHRVDLAVVSRDSGGQRVKEAMAAVRAALTGAELEMPGWRCVLLVPVFSDVARSGIEIWRAMMRLKVVVEEVET